MHQHSTEPTILDFGDFNLQPVRLSSSATAVDVTHAVNDELTSAGYDLDTITLTPSADGATVGVFDGTSHMLGTVTVTPPKPDYWLTLADDLRQLADQVATLVGTPELPGATGTRLTFGYSYLEQHADQSVQVVDALAATFNADAETKTEGRGRTRQTRRVMEGRLGKLRLHAQATLPNPPLARQSRAVLEAELEQLRAQLAEGGATR